MTRTEMLQQIEGLYVGQLNEEEMRLFEQAVMYGWASRHYEGPAGFLGLAKVRLEPIEAQPVENEYSREMARTEADALTNT